MDPNTTGMIPFVALMAAWVEGVPSVTIRSWCAPRFAETPCRRT
jgi:hypothetical protein